MTVGQASTTTAITSSPNPSVTGQPVTLTATILAVSPGTGTPTGTVNFYSGSTLLDTATLSDGVATYTTTTLPTGTSSIDGGVLGRHQLHRQHVGDVNQVVAEGTATVSLSASNTNPFAPPGDHAHGDRLGDLRLGTPTGTVTFYDSNGDRPRHGHAHQRHGHADRQRPCRSAQESITAVVLGRLELPGATSTPLSIWSSAARPTCLSTRSTRTCSASRRTSAPTLWIALINGGYPPKVVATYILQSKAARVAAVE